MKVLAIPSAGIRVITNTPIDTYYTIQNLMDDGHSLEDMEWEK